MRDLRSMWAMESQSPLPSCSSENVSVSTNAARSAKEASSSIRFCSTAEIKRGNVYPSRLESSKDVHGIQGRGKARHKSGVEIVVRTMAIDD